MSTFTERHHRFLLSLTSRSRLCGLLRSRGLRQSVEARRTWGSWLPRLRGVCSRSRSLAIQFIERFGQLLSTSQLLRCE